MRSSRGMNLRLILELRGVKRRELRSNTPRCAKVARMAIRMIVGIVGLVGVSICGLIATFLNFELVDKVNEKLPKEKSFDRLIWHPVKYERLSSEYKRLYPDGPLPSKIRIVTGIMLACLAFCVWGFHVFSK
jgi:hypothetical protein